jgi:hypothetical protein
MALVIDPDLKTAVQPIPLGSLFDPQSGTLTLTGTGFFDFNRKQSGEILSGVNHNRDLITQLETVYVAADLVLTAAILAEAVVRADDDGALATLITALNVEVDGNTASVTTIAAAVGDIEGNLSAAYGVTVNVDGRVAALKLLSDGTTATASILGDLIYFGPQTVFDTATETFITEVGSIRSRYGTAFGASSDLIRWDGPVAVAQNSETPTNGYLAIKTDGTIYHNAAALSWGATAAEAAASNAQVQPPGVNRLKFTSFSRGVPETYWPSFIYVPASVTQYRVYPTLLESLSAFECTWGAYAGTVAALASQSGTSGIPVYPGEKLAIGYKYGLYGTSSISAQISYYDASGTYLTATTSSTFSSFAGRWQQAAFFSTVPASAAFAQFVVFFTGTGAGAGQAYIAEPYVIGVPSAATVHPVFSHGSDNAQNADVTGDNQAADVAPGAVTDTAADSTDASTALSNNTWTNVASATVAVAAGADIIVNGFCFHVANYSGGASGSAAVTAQVRLRRDSTVLRTQDATTYVYLTGGPGSLTSASRGPTTISDVDLSLSAGTYTYTLQANINLNSVGASSTTRDISNRLLWVTQLKR